MLWTGAKLVVGRIESFAIGAGLKTISVVLRTHLFTLATLALALESSRKFSKIPVETQTLMDSLIS